MLLDRIELDNILSFRHVNLGLCPLSVLIGANASGKSNLIRALSLLSSLPKGLQGEIAAGGGPRGWIGLDQPKNGRTRNRQGASFRK